MNKPCEYCGATLPLGIDKHTRRIRSHHFSICKQRPKPDEAVNQLDRDIWRRVVDDALIIANIGCTEDTDTLETAKQKLNLLLCHSQDIGAYFAKEQQPAEPRTLLEQHDLEQSPEYRKGYEDGRLKGFDVGQRYASDRQQPAREPLTEHERAELERLRALVNTPQLHDFAAAVVLEAAHQRERWGSAHDAGKAPEDWFWLLGYLGGKALASAKAGNTDKAMHHTISSAAALANWHAALCGEHTAMRPGINPAEHSIGTSGGEA